jgi:hypothetical protein|eukprot:COSAG06_NODE_2414_length_6916_cov_66.899956_4_plen_85_part_00
MFIDAYVEDHKYMSLWNRRNQHDKTSCAGLLSLHHSFDDVAGLLVVPPRGPIPTALPLSPQAPASGSGNGSRPPTPAHTDTVTQ